MSCQVIIYIYIYIYHNLVLRRPYSLKSLKATVPIYINIRVAHFFFFVLRIVPYAPVCFHFWLSLRFFSNLYVLFYHISCNPCFFYVMLNCQCNAASETCTEYSCGSHEFTPVLEGFVLLNLLFSMQCFQDHYLSFCPFSFVLRFTACDYNFGIFKLLVNIKIKLVR